MSSILMLLLLKTITTSSSWMDERWEVVFGMVEVHQQPKRPSWWRRS